MSHRCNRKGEMPVFLDGLDEAGSEDCEAADSAMPACPIRISGKQIGLSRVAVKLQGAGAGDKRASSKEYTTIINPQKISGSVSCYFETGDGARDRCRRWREILRPGTTIVTQIYRVTGRSTSSCACRRRVAGGDGTADLLRRSTGFPGIVACSCSTILSRIKDVKGLRL